LVDVLLFDMTYGQQKIMFQQFLIIYFFVKLGLTTCNCAKNWRWNKNPY